VAGSKGWPLNQGDPACQSSTISSGEEYREKELARRQAAQMIENAQTDAELMPLLTPDQQAKFNGKLAAMRRQQEQRAEQHRHQRRPNGPHPILPAPPL
jgi:hypothetical protein